MAERNVDHPSAGKRSYAWPTPAGWRESNRKEGNEKTGTARLCRFAKATTAEVDSRELSRDEQTGAAETLTLWSAAVDADAYLTTRNTAPPAEFHS